MIVLVSLIALLRYFLVSMIFRMVHPIPTSPFIQLNDFGTCSTFFVWFAYKLSCAHAYMRRLALRRDHGLV